MADEGQPGRKRAGRGVSRRGFLKGAAIGTGLAATDLAFLANMAEAAPNLVSVENALAGSPPSQWDIFPDDSIEGFATQVSVNAGSTVQFKIRTVSTKYKIDIYRMGWYGGNGARKVATVQPSVPLPQAQPAPITDSNGTGVIDCGNWALSASWNVPANACSGVYFANLIRLDAEGSNRIMFVVRNDNRTADIMLQTADTTHQAYNQWGGNSMYRGTAAWGRATKVSYNRPLDPWMLENEFWYAEYPLVRWLERNGYNVTYCAGADTDRAGSQLLNKKVFISSGHDEYWSGAQRANVEAARDAGVHLIFMTGNDVFWKIRWENSVDGSGTPYRTMVCYKETHANAKVDPSPEWTGTWRDPRFSPPSNGGRPENRLTGTLFKAMNPANDFDFNIRVPYQYSRFRLWRNTSIATLLSTQTATLANGTLGYEWNTDEDNGFRPPGLIRLSQTTQTASDVLQDYGNTYISAPLTHYLTQYRAPSGALVFSTGTVQWAWGLDDFHTSRPDQTVPQDVRMQQATLNLLADMGVQPATKQSNLVTASKSTDTVPPVTTITAPAAGVTVPIGSPATIAGSAVDSGGGRVAGVEVSTDGGATWHPATGTTSWSYTFTPLALGPVTIKARAVDDSCNLESPGATRTITAGPRSLPCSIWPTGTTPAVLAENDGSPLEVGVKFRASMDGFITAIRFYKGAGNTGVHVGHLWSTSGALLGTVTFSGETASGWQQANFSKPIAVSAGTTYVASYWAPNGHYSKNANYFASAYDLAPLRALASGEDGPNGVYRAGSSGFPTSTFGAANYWVDIVFDNDDHLTPTVVDRSPAPGIEAVALSPTVAATFSEAMNGGSIGFELRGPGNTLVAGNTTYDAPTRQVQFTPTSPLAARTTYTAKVVSGQDSLGNAMAAPVSWTFTTTTAPGDLPTSVWDSSAVPAVASSGDTNLIEVGLKFSADIDGQITGLRFYKGSANSGTHIGHLWTIGGTLLGTVTFATESASGWQQANFDAPIPVQKNAVYVATYLAPVGQYAKSENYFGSAVVRGPLRALANGTAGPNGIYRYGGGFPSDTWNSSNYWVDVMLGVPPDVTGPAVDDRAPAPGIEAVATTTTVTAQFNEPINPATLAFALRGPGNNAVPASVNYDAGTRRATLTPNAALALATQYTAEVSAADTNGNAMPAPLTWTFTTVTAAGHTPATIWDTSAVPAVPAQADASAVEIGVKFRADVDGAVRAIRFYKGPGNAGPHVGHLWSAAGALLGSASFDNETATGWQQASFSQPIEITAGQTYVASYHAPAGRYALTAGGLSGAGVDRPPLHALRDGVDGGNGVYGYGAGGFPTNSFGGGNYWVDVVFDDVAGPTVTAQGPVPNAASVALDARMVATFSEPVQSGSVVFQLRDSLGALVPASVSYDGTAQTATLTPNSTLAGAKTYTATVSGAVDGVGNGMGAPVSWSFTTVGGGLVSLFSPADVPATPASNDNGAVNVGMKFRSTVAGQVQGVRFYKGAGNNGPHSGHLWTASGTLLETATFTGESLSGWQYAAFPAPVAVSPDTIYVVSYHAPGGRYATSSGYFGGDNVTNGPLVGPGAASGEANGVYAYGAGAGFPTNSFGSTNYWVDIAFLPS